jgi:hypothetical protein
MSERVLKRGAKVKANGLHGCVPFQGKEGIVSQVINDYTCVQFNDIEYPDGVWSRREELDFVEEPSPETETSLFPADAKARKEIPLASGVLDYFTSALIEVAKVSFEGNKQHNPGQELHWARGKSMDQSDTILRHFVERGTVDTDGIRHSAKMAWRALALLQLELEAAGAPKARGVK